MSEPIPTNTTDYTALLSQLDEADPIECAFMALVITHPDQVDGSCDHNWKPGDR
jgi:hypothetical protein